MRFVSRALVVAVGLLAIGGISTSVRANDEMTGKFKLSQPTQWQSTVLPAGDYSFRLVHVQSDALLLLVSGAKKSLDLMIFTQSACASCRGGGLKIAVEGVNRVVTALDIPGYHLDFSSSQSAGGSQQQAKRPAPTSDQVAVSYTQD